MGAAVVTSVFIGSVWAGENKAIIKQFKKENPTLFVFLVMVVSFFLMSLFGGVMVLLLGIKLPLLCKFLKNIVIIIINLKMRIHKMEFFLMEYSTTLCGLQENKCKAAVY